MRLEHVHGFLGFDTETTGVNTDTDRIVTASLIVATPNEDPQDWGGNTIMINPGIEIPAGATAIHGITTETARIAGEKPDEALPFIVETIKEAWEDDMPLVCHNAAYDLSILAAECDRYGLKRFKVEGPILDTMVLHRMCTKQRKATLAVVAPFYGVKNVEAHSSESDTKATLSVLVGMIARFPRLSNTDLRDLYTAQKQAHRAWAKDMQNYFNRVGNTDQVNVDWPIKGIG